MPKAKVDKTYVRPDNTAVLTCVHCGLQKIIPTKTFKGYKHKLKVKCNCNRTFMVILEFRSRLRKRTYLRGSYINHSQGNIEGLLIVLDISVTGLAFSSLDIRKFKVGDELSLEFRLDDEHGTEIKKEVIVKDLRQKTVGCEYENPETTFGGALGNYVMS